jgi:dTDP-4-dehydrorhamnose reductase
MYKEDDLSDAEDLYGRTKLLGEVASANALTLRTSIIGRELTTHHSLLEWFLSNRGGRVNGYCKSIYSGVTTNHLSDVVLSIILNNPRLQGLYQIASEPISKYDLLLLLRKAYALNITIDPVNGEDVDRSMDGSEFCSATGYICPPWPVLVQQMAADTTPYGEWL